MESASEEEEEEEEEEERVPTVSEASECLNKLLKFIQAQENVSDSMFGAIQDLDNFILTSSIRNRKQRRITAYFKRA